ncbi:RNA polymerase sigma factor [Microbacterium sp. USTB-Y]|uniref:RNA polymerase sigma factor n=1 Tax=Microbacterium sp. USTB-Y TaxID=2823692 RepID=UPI002041F34A|nr:sigma-70 family RNA polymerase sigma factor [Microbacterium sp. USTB-Y]
MTASDPPVDRAVPRAVDAAWRIEWPQLVAVLTRLVGDMTLAEDLAQDAHVAALEQWPRDGVPANPGAWLTVTAKRRAIDRIRRDSTLARKLPLLEGEILSSLDAGSSDPAAAVDEEISDDLLRMLFTACHPALPRASQVALTLRMVGGLTTDEIARAYVTATPTIVRRISRAKKIIRDERIPYEVPSGAELAERLDAVLEVVYLVFNEGYAATAGDDWMRIDLCTEALRLARVLSGLLPAEPEVAGLAALLELQASRLRARYDPAGRPVLLRDQDRTRWDRLLIRRGYAALARAHTLARDRGRPPGRYALQAAIAAAHAMAPTQPQTDWRRIAGLYAVLAARFPSPIVELNRAVAVAELHGPAAGLELVDAVVAGGTIDDYHLLHAVRGDLLLRLGRTAEAGRELERAARLTANTAEQALLLDRAARPGAR